MVKIPENMEYDNDIDYSVKVTRIVLNLIGLWPSASEDSTLKKFSIKLLQALCQFLLYFTLIPGLLKMFLKETNPRIMLKMVGPMCNCLMGIFKYTMLARCTNEIKDCVTTMQFDWNNAKFIEYRKIMLEYAKAGDNMAIVATMFVYISGFSYRAIVPLIKGTTVTAQNVTIRPLPMPGYYVFFNPQISPTYETVFTLQFLTGFIQYSVTSGGVSLAASLALHACGQLKILMRRLEELTEEGQYQRKRTEQQLTSVVQHHIRIKRFVSLIENILQYVCLVEVIGCTLILCLLGYYLILEWENSDSVALLTYSLLLLTFAFNIFMLCFIGELLNDQGLKVHVTACTLKWYHLPDKTAKCLVLIVAMSCSPIHITAGKFMDLSLNSFVAILKTSVAYLNMLRATSI